MNELRISSIESSKPSSKQEILLFLKKNGKTDLKKLSEQLNMTKMGVLKHITALEELGYIDRENQKASKGRPKVFFKLSETTRDNVFPNNYSNLTNYFLSFIEENYGIGDVEKALKQRNRETKEKYNQELVGNTLEERLTCLRSIRDNEGYMAELNKLSENTHELLEYNCPIFKIAEKYSVTCTFEQEMFEELLNANIDTKHRVVNGDNVCRFLITKS